MRRLLAIAVLGAVALLPLSAQAQRGMGGRGGGGRSMGGRAPAAPARVSPGFSSGRGMAGRTVSPSGRVIGGRGRSSFNRIRPPFGVGGCFGAFPCRNNRFFFHNPFFFGSGFGFGLGFGFPFSYPYSYIPGFDTGYYGPPPQQPVVSPDNTSSNDVQLALEMQRLSDQVEFMREEQSRQASAARTSGSSLSAQQPAASTTFVFRDGHRIATQNYAIAGQTLWILSEHMARKIALADLDLAATEQVNAANGVDLHISEPPAH